MKLFTAWVKHHQIAAFFLITFTITWGLGFSYNAVLQKSLFLVNRMWKKLPASHPAVYQSSVLDV